MFIVNFCCFIHLWLKQFHNSQFNIVFDSDMAVMFTWILNNDGGR